MMNDSSVWGILRAGEGVVAIKDVAYVGDSNNE